MITFAANNEFFRKRKRVHRACKTCKKRRKRCSHTFDEDTEGGSSSKTANFAALAPTSDQDTVQAGLSTELPAPTTEAEAGDGRLLILSPQSHHENAGSTTPPNFVGYLSPEAVLREKIHERGQAARSQYIPVGQWLQGREDEKDPGVGTGSRALATPLTQTSPRSSQSSAVQQALQAYLDAAGVSIIPPRRHQDALLNIYLEYVQPLLPILDQKIFQARYSQGMEPRMLIQAVCIVASKHEKARPHLLLLDEPQPLSPREFSQRLYNSIITAIEAKIEANRIVLIQVLALLSLHCEGPDGAEQASMHLAQAIHHAHTFGLQFGHQWKHSRDSSLENLENLFWCLWSLDKINACINGRPLIMHDRDNGLAKLPTDPERRQSPFGVWLQIAEMLDKVIDFYRPGVDPALTGWEDDFLGFEELVGDGEDRLNGPMITLLALFHHAVAMASHKSLSVNDPVRSTQSYIRQSLSATRVISILSTEPHENLPPLPIIPYALSLAMSVVYRHFRQRKLQMHKNRAKEELKSCVTLLNRLRPSWWTAGAMADLGMAALSNADRSNRPKPAHMTEGNAFQKSAMASLAQNNDQSHQTTIDSAIDPRLQGQQLTISPRVSFHLDTLPQMPGQHPISSERAEQSPLNDLDVTDSSPGWLNFDNAFENIDTLLGSAGADLSNELLKPFNYEGLDFFDTGTGS